MQAQHVSLTEVARTQKPEDERRFVRWRVAIPCQVNWAGQMVNAWLDNLSFGGALLHRAVIAPSPGEKVELHLCTGSESPLRCVFQAVVVHSCWDLSKGEKAGLFGLAFDALEGHQAPRLVQLLRRFALGQAEATTAARSHPRTFGLPPAA